MGFTKYFDRAGWAAAATGATAGLALLAAPALAAPALADGHQAATRQAAGAAYTFQTLDNPADPTFNQLLGINSQGLVAGYFGSGEAGHPNKGYLLSPPYEQPDFAAENFPGSAQTQVTGLNNLGDTAGFWVGAGGTSHGFVQWNGVFASYDNPSTPHTKGAVNQLLGINNKGVAVGFYNNAAGHSRAYQVNQDTGVFTPVNVPGARDAVAAAINNAGDIAGFSTDAAGTTSSFLLAGGRLITYQFPGGSNTQALGINSKDQIAGSYTDVTGAAHGFVLTSPMGPVSHWQTIDDPNGAGSTVVNGLDTAGDLVGFYTDQAGNTHGMLATPAVITTRHLDLGPMPTGTVSLGTNAQGQVTATLAVSGLTPGSAHTVRIVDPAGTVTVAGFPAVHVDDVGQVNTTVSSTFTGTIPAGSRLQILNGNGGGSVASEPIARTSPLHGTAGGSPLALTAVEMNPQGASFGTPQGQATVSYDPATQKLAVTVTASGLTPGKHAAHVHLGSCAHQGDVRYMLADFTANSHGQIVNQTRVVTGVTTPIPPSGWYLNLHQGNSNTILKDGHPAIAFRPLLCSGI